MFTLQRLVATLALVSAAIVCWWIAAPVALGGSTSYIVVHGISMEPTYTQGDLVVVRPRPQYSVHDIVAYRAQGMGIVGPNGVGVVIHRIIGGDDGNGFQMQGDNNPEPDSATPRPEHILGSAVLHVPWAGRVFEFGQRREVSAAAIAIVSVWPLLFAEAVRRRRRGGRTVTVQTASTSSAGGGAGGGGPLSEAPRAVVLAFFATSGLAALAALLAVVAFRQAPTQSRMEPRVQYTQSGAFGYSIDVAPAAIYPRASVGPLPGAEAKDAATPEQAVFTRLAQAINVEYRYALESKDASALRGTVRADLEVRAADGWTKTDEITPPTAFEGAGVYTTARIDMRALTALLEQIEAETGFQARSYEVVVKPVVNIEGRIGGEPVQETFISSFPVKVDPMRVMPQGALRQSTPTTRADLVTTPRLIGIGARQATVEQARLASAGAATGMGAVTALLASVIFLGLGRGEEAKIRARYGSLLLHVQASEDGTVRDRVRVVSMRDLARLARRDGGLIMEETERLGPRYSVRDGDTVYEFVPEGQGHRQRFAEFVARHDVGPSPSASSE